MSDITITPCTASDVSTLKNLSISTFSDTFKAHNTENDFDQYLKNAFSESQLLRELQSDGTSFYFMHHKDSLAGYLKLNLHPSQTDINDKNSVEIERIYVKKEFKGKGLGTSLIEFSIEFARKNNKSYTWLGVWEKNAAALSFYEKMGFYKTGEHFFRLGEDLQKDFILRKDL